MQASESPGGLGADATNPDFPVGTMPGLCIVQDSPTCLTDHKYEFGTPPDCESKEVPKCEFEALPKATAFKYETDTNTAKTAKIAACGAENAPHKKMPELAI